IDFHFAVKNQLLTGLQPSFKIATMKEFARQRTRIVLNEEMIDRIAAIHAANRLPAHDLCTQRVCSIRLDVPNLGKMNTVFIAERKIIEQIFQRVNPALGEEFGACGPTPLIIRTWVCRLTGMYLLLYHSPVSDAFRETCVYRIRMTRVGAGCTAWAPIW